MWARRSVGTERMKLSRKLSRCRRRAVLLAAAVAACGGDGRSEPGAGADGGPRPGAAAADGGVAGVPGEHGPWARRYYEAYLAETLRGDAEAARTIYQQVVAGAADEDPVAAARAALRLADLELVAGRRREALELVARASVLGGADLEILERADRMQAQIASLRAQGTEVRGPPVGTEPAGASAAAAKLFAQAEQLLAVYHRRELQPQLEVLRQGVRAKEFAMGQAERAYRAVVALGEPGPAAAAEFRIGSLYHDLALALMFDLPHELEAREAEKLRRSLRGQALAHLRKARAAYERSIAAAAAGASGPALERWRLAAELGQRAVDDLLRGRQ
jgi:hypothetical protein